MTKTEMVAAMRKGKKVRHSGVMNDGEWWALVKIDGIECKVAPVGGLYWLEFWPKDGWEVIGELTLS